MKIIEKKLKIIKRKGITLIKNGSFALKNWYFDDKSQSLLSDIEVEESKVDFNDKYR